MAVSFYFRLERYSWSLSWLRHETRVLCYSLLFLHSQRDASSMPLWRYVEYTHLQQTLACGQLQMYFIHHHTSLLRRFMTAHIFNRSLLSAITVLQGLHECVFNIFRYFFFYYYLFISTFFLLGICKLITQLHLEFFFFFWCLAPPISPKEIASQHLAAAQTPSAPVDVQADQHLAQVACCRGDNEGCEGEFEGSFGRSSLPCMPALQVEWAKCPLAGASIHLVGDLPLDGAYSNTVNKFYFGLSKRVKHGAIILHVRWQVFDLKAKRFFTLGKP